MPCPVLESIICLLSSCEYELKFLRMGLGAECRILEKGMSFETREQLPRKRFAKEYVTDKNKDEE